MQSATVGLPWANEVFYCGLVASDEAGNRSPVSNLVPVYAAEFTTTTDDSQVGLILTNLLASVVTNKLIS